VADIWGRNTRFAPVVKEEVLDKIAPLWDVNSVEVLFSD